MYSDTLSHTSIRCIFRSQYSGVHHACHAFPPGQNETITGLKALNGIAHIKFYFRACLFFFFFFLCDLHFLAIVSLFWHLFILFDINILLQIYKASCCTSVFCGKLELLFCRQVLKYLLTKDWVMELHTLKLVAECQPPWLSVVWSSKQFWTDFSC